MQEKGLVSHDIISISAEYAVLILGGQIKSIYYLIFNVLKSVAAR